jgi:hypothetical protein
LIPARGANATRLSGGALTWGSSHLEKT